MKKELTLEKVYQAAYTLKDIVRKTEVMIASGLTDNCDLYLKTENLQVTGSFKVRGASYMMSTLSKKEKEKGVIACSAGNHAQGVALAAKENGIHATIFVPDTAPISKVEATKKYGAEVVLVNGVYDDAYEAAQKMQKETGKTFIHPFGDIAVIAGQGTVGLEIVEQVPDVEAIVVPVGGGGLISGIAYTVKKLKPSCKVYGVQAKGAACMVNSINEGHLCNTDCVSTFADGIAVKNPSGTTYDICKEYVDEMVYVTDDEIAGSILSLIEQQKLIAEGAGAVAVAAILNDKLPVKNKKVVAVVSGGNIDVNILSRVIHRGLLSSGRKSDLNIEMIDRPGQLKEISSIIADLGANVVRVNHNYGGENTDINECSLRISMETKNHEHLSEIKQAITNAGYRIVN